MMSVSANSEAILNTSIDPAILASINSDIAVNVNKINQNMLSIGINDVRT